MAHNRTFPAQADNTPQSLMLEYLSHGIETLRAVKHTIKTTTPTQAAKTEMFRRLSGVQGNLETICLALKPR